MEAAIGGAGPGYRDGRSVGGNYFRGELRMRLNFHTLPGMPRVSLRTATVASTPITTNSAKQIAAITRIGIGHLNLIVRRRLPLFGDPGHRSE